MKVKLTDTADEVIESADVMVILTGWNEFKTICETTDKKVIDFRYILDGALLLPLCSVIYLGNGRVKASVGLKGEEYGCYPRRCKIHR